MDGPAPDTTAAKPAARSRMMSLFVSGMASPFVGRQIDCRGGRPVLAAGSLLGALACAVLATAQGPWTLLLGWLLAGAAMSACLYDPALATLHLDGTQVSDAGKADLRAALPNCRVKR